MYLMNDDKVEFCKHFSPFLCVIIQNVFTINYEFSTFHVYFFCKYLSIKEAIYNSNPNF